MNSSIWASWQVYAIGSAIFAALTAIFGKIGVSGINSNFATFIRTIVILVVTAIIVSMRHEWQKMHTVSRTTLLFLVLSGVATGLSWLCYYRALQLGPASKVAPVDKLSVVFVIGLGVLFLGEPLGLKVVLGGLLILAGSLVMML
jgi:transporter family protein